MSSNRPTRRFPEDLEESGRTPECEMAFHQYCHPQDVYASETPRPGERPLFSITCTCECHKIPPPRDDTE
ncbi:hypothetical protein [Streptomyces roseolilacinus]|uniref:hypothetical protein n=1 Tax=Streptomyces roseolilacinus TaxID=66904 RepID=UPI003803B4FA